MAFFNTILLLKLNIRTHHVNSFPPFFNYISEGFLCLISLVGAALQRCLHRPPSPHLLFFLSVISVSPTPSTGVESRTSHTLSYILSFVFRTGSHKVNLASLRFALYPRLALTSCSPFFRLPSSCQPVCLLLVLKDLFPFVQQTPAADKYSSSEFGICSQRYPSYPLPRSSILLLFLTH